MGSTNTGHGLLGLREAKARLDVVSSLNQGEQREMPNFITWSNGALLTAGILHLPHVSSDANGGQPLHSQADGRTFK